MNVMTYKDSEIVIGLVGATGTNLNEVINMLERQLRCFGYGTETIDLAEDVLSSFEKGVPEECHDYEFDDFSALPQSINLEKHKYYKNTHRMMDIGNHLRTIFGSGAIALSAINEINKRRPASKDISEDAPYIKVKTAYIIKSLKHKNEVSLLRATYGNGFYLFGVYADETTRRKNLINKRMDEKSAIDLMKRDESEVDEFGQHTSDVYQLSDFFVRSEDSIEAKTNNIQRIVNLIFGDPHTTPTFGEHAMFMAFCASLRSADMSRQIGAVICRNNDILSMGANECPKSGGGQYWLEFHKDIRKYQDEPLGRDYMRGEDSNKKQFRIIAKDVYEAITGEPDCPDEIYKSLKKTSLGDLTEYGRVVHAEMEALSACGRNGISTRDAQLYCTTFPCHVCAKHIIAAGINTVVYIEPYPKSKTFEFFSDSVSKDERDEGGKVVFVPFFGVGPRRYIEMFSMDNGIVPGKQRQNKSTGKKIDWHPDYDNGYIRNQMLPTSYIQHEVEYSIIYNQLISKNFMELFPQNQGAEHGRVDMRLDDLQEIKDKWPKDQQNIIPLNKSIVYS